MKHIKLFEQFKDDNKRVVIFPGRFQPLHLGHLASLKKTSELFGLPVIPIQILSKKEESPFPESLLLKIGKAIQQENSSWMADYFIYPTNKPTVIPQMVKFLRDFGYYPVGLGAGSDRINSYNRQIDYLNSDKSDVPMSEPFVSKVVSQRGGDEISGTKVRQSIKDDDFDSFKQMTSKSIHKYFNELKKYL